MRESQIEDYLVERVKALGGEVRKVKWIGRNGAPDRCVMLPSLLSTKSGWSTTIWFELKAPGEKPKPHQAREHERMRRMGQRVEVVDSFERVDEVLVNSQQVGAGKTAVAAESCRHDTPFRYECEECVNEALLK